MLLENLPAAALRARGFSLGGVVALEMIARAPGRVARLALIDTTARPDPPENWRARRNAVARAAEVGVERYVTHKLWSLYSLDQTANAGNCALSAPCRRRRARGVR